MEGDTRPDLELLVRRLTPGSGELFALLDAARDQSIPARLAGSADEYVSLYDGDKGKELEQFGPWLVLLKAGSKLLTQLLQEGWGKSWGVYLSSTVPVRDLRKHLRRFLLVKLPDGSEAYFRFYDPRVLRTYLPTCNANEASAFFGPIERFVMEDENPIRAIEFRPGREGPVVQMAAELTKAGM